MAAGDLEAPRSGWSAGIKAAGRNRALLLVIGVVVASAVVGWVAGRNIRSPAEEAARKAPPKPSLITVPVERRQLTEDVVTRGTVGFGSPMTVTLPGTSLRQGNSIVTVPPKLGEELKEGSVALVVSGQPVLVLQGDQPTYRDLAEGASGQDVRQLEAGLFRLGHNPGPQDGKFDRATRNAVVSLFNAVGFGPGSGNVAANELVFFPKLPVRVDEVSVKAGAAPDGPVMTVTNPQVTVASSLSAEDAKLVKEGVAAALEDPDRGIRVTGTVSRVATKPGTDDVEAQRYYLEVIPTDPPPSVTGSAVVVTIAVRSTEAEVLAAPLAALSTSADRTTRVEVLGSDGVTRSVQVKPGLSAKGMVEISPVDGTLVAGDQVVVGVASTTNTTKTSSGGTNGP